MSYLTSALGPGERVEYEAKRHWIDYVQGAVLLAVAAISLLYIPDREIAQILGAIFGGLGLLSWGHAWLVNRTTVLAVTNRKLVAKQGILSNYSIEQQLGKVDAITIDRSLLGRILDYGTVRVSGSGISTSSFSRIAAPYEFRSRVERALHTGAAVP
jgi:hypothetical protein